MVVLIASDDVFYTVNFDILMVNLDNYAGRITSNTLEKRCPFHTAKHLVRLSRPSHQHNYPNSAIRMSKFTH
jgi:hypothetical protein